MQHKIFLVLQDLNSKISSAAHMIGVLHIYPNTQSAASILAYLGVTHSLLGCSVLHSAFAAHMSEVLQIYPNTQSAASILAYLGVKHSVL